MFFTSIPMPNHHLFFLNSRLYQKPINKAIKKRSIFLPPLIVANIRIHYMVSKKQDNEWEGTQQMKYFCAHI